MCWLKEERENIASNKLDQFANNHQKDTYPEELIGLIIGTFYRIVSFLLTL